MLINKRTVKKRMNFFFKKFFSKGLTNAMKNSIIKTVDRSVTTKKGKMNDDEDDNERSYDV